jgi:hypothetical protein
MAERRPRQRLPEGRRARAAPENLIAIPDV